MLQCSKKYLLCSKVVPIMLTILPIMLIIIFIRIKFAMICVAQIKLKMVTLAVLLLGQGQRLLSMVILKHE